MHRHKHSLELSKEPSDDCSTSTPFHFRVYKSDIDQQVSVELGRQPNTLRSLEGPCVPVEFLSILIHDKLLSKRVPCPDTQRSAFRSVEINTVIKLTDR